jgi:hypothetical protein
MATKRKDPKRVEAAKKAAKTRAANKARAEADERAAYVPPEIRASLDPTSDQPR